MVVDIIDSYYSTKRKILGAPAEFSCLQATRRGIEVAPIAPWHPGHQRWCTLGVIAAEPAHWDALSCREVPSPPVAGGRSSTQSLLRPGRTGALSTLHCRGEPRVAAAGGMPMRVATPGAVTG
jgi:hypothetical protein